MFNKHFKIIPLIILFFMVFCVNTVFSGWSVSNSSCNNNSNNNSSNNSSDNFNNNSSNNSNNNCIELNVPLYDPIKDEQFRTLTHENDDSYGGSIFNIFTRYLYNITLYFAGTVLIAFMVWGGIQMMLSRGKESAFTAKEKIIMSIQGIILLLFAGYFLYIINPQFFTME